MSRLRPRTIAIGVLILLLAAAPFVPRGEDDDGFRPSTDAETGVLRSADTAGASRITPAMQAEIDRVVAAGRAVGRISARQAPTQLADDLVRCADFEGQRYCLGSGWTEQTQAQVQAKTAAAARAVAARTTYDGRVTNTGDLDARALLQREASMTPAQRAAADRAELTDAARSVAKVWLLRHEIEGVPLPDGFLAAHPEARLRTGAAASPSATPQTTQAKVKHRRDYPRRSVVLNPRDVAEQSQTYWCGPTSMQMIVWGWRHRRQSQQHWANRLGTTTSGTAITDMVRVVNQDTGWDRERRAGRYITLDISNYSFGKWILLMMRHIHDYRAPVVLHPVLRKQYYPYLDDDASGHFQVGRGYDKNGPKPALLGYFEPWNQQRFDPSEPYIARVQWRNAYRSYRANQAHFQHNVGV